MEGCVATGELLQILTEPEYKVINLTFAEQLTVIEAAHRLGIPRAEVLSLQKSATRRMRACLYEEE